MTKKAQRRSAAKLKTLDSFLQEEGKLQEFEAVAVKEATQISKPRAASSRTPTKTATRKSYDFSAG